MCTRKVNLDLEALAKGRMNQEGRGGRRKAALRSEVGGRQRGRPTEATTRDNTMTNERRETTTVVPEILLNP